VSSTSISTTDLYRLLVEQVEDYAIFALDRGGHVVSWNPGAQRFKGYTATEIVGQHFSVFYPPDDVAARKPWVELEVATAEGRLEDEGWRVRKDGTRFWANVVITALRTPDGELVGFAKITRDLTRRKLAEQQAIEDARRLASEETLRRTAESRTRDLADVLEQLRNHAEELDQRRQEADEANRTKTSFLAAMSHELRTPLNAIAGYAELLLLGVRGPVNDEQSADLHRIRRSQQHLLGLINDILNFSRIDAGHVTYQIERVSLASVVDSVSLMIMPQATSRGISFTPQPCPSSIIALADASKVEQVLLNLLTNAVKFTPAGGLVELRCDARDGMVIAEVSDNGVGIPADRLRDIFEPFVQLNRSLENPGEGVGLGLAISRDLARGMNGDLTVRSEVGVGSLFTLELPRAAPLRVPDER
jgi:PAS domain S-box-containing protein